MTTKIKTAAICTAVILITVLGILLTPPGDTKCRLLETAYTEQDELSGEWYDRVQQACKALRTNKTGCRGRDASGNYNADKKECKR